MKQRFRPRFAGIFKPQRLADDLMKRFIKRISTGLFPSAPSTRNHYQAEAESDESLRIKSVSFLTSINIGLNDIYLRIDRKKGEIHYDVAYWRWAKYCILGAFFLTIIIAGFGLTLFLLLWPKGQHLPLAPTMLWSAFLVLWGVVWPWILISMHKKPAEQSLLQLLDEINHEI